MGIRCPIQSSSLRLIYSTGIFLTVLKLEEGSLIFRTSTMAMSTIWQQTHRDKFGLALDT